ncbi:gamma-tubulin complex component [Cordyceps militaris]|uniref:Spindle pole body component n=1 Tax=Cordyceps militaris TaxID=73501 RepID=A0A2H4SVM0_CORMI|nr:gamma-tubulin complex component [Cordyceps militaris]
MLHEILLSLSGHPSPLLTAELSDSSASSALSPSERQLLASAAHLSDLHVKLAAHAARITASHPSTVCRAVATAIQTVHLAALRRRVLDVEARILRHDPHLVGAYAIVPLTAVVGAFEPWTRRLEWLWEVVRFLEAPACCGARAMDRLRAELQSGYRDVEEAAQSLVAAAETAWLRQVAAWIFYGRLPSGGGSGDDDFFVRPADGPDEDYVSVADLLPAFVTPATARSMLFIGRSLNQIRARSGASGTTLSTTSGFHNTAAKLQAIADLASPLSAASFTGTIRDIRQSLSQDILEQILPLSEVMSTMQLLREFFLLGRGEFAMALTHEADERIRGRWRRAGNLAAAAQPPDKDDAVRNVTVKSGEVAAALARAWASLSSFEQRRHPSSSGDHDSDALLDRARDLLRLQLVKARPDSSSPLARPGLSAAAVARLADAPFHALLFSVPVVLAMRLPPAVDMVLGPSDMQLYGCAHAYLVALRRAHIRLTGLWKLTSLRRHYPGPRGAGAHAQELRQRWSARAQVLRGTWTAASAAVFFLGETEAYFQTEVVAGSWRGFRAWLTGDSAQQDTTAPPPPDDMDMSDDDDITTTPAPTTSASSAAAPPRHARHDQQTLATGHAVYLDTLVHRLLLTQETYTRPLHALLVQMDHLVTHAHRLHGIFTSRDLETDAGVVDAFTDLAAEEAQVLRQLRAVAASVRAGMDHVVAALERLSVDEGFLQTWEGETAVAAQMEDLAPGEAYRPARVGGLNRLLMQLKFGS